MIFEIDTLLLSLLSIMRKDGLAKRGFELYELVWIKIPSGGIAEKPKNRSIRIITASTSLCLSEFVFFCLLVIHEVNSSGNDMVKRSSFISNNEYCKYLAIIGVSYKIVKVLRNMKSPERNRTSLLKIGYEYHNYSEHDPNPSIQIPNGIRTSSQISDSWQTRFFSK